MSAQDMINAWGARKWPAHAGKQFTLETEDRGSGCPTCGYTDIRIIVYAGSTEVAELRADFSDLLQEIIEQGVPA